MKAIVLLFEHTTLRKASQAETGKENEWEFSFLKISEERIFRSQSFSLLSGHFPQTMFCFAWKNVDLDFHQ